ncbi:MAG TPA: hypothetical protein VGK67_31260 [Myxococcales bacterium]|jgi:hypothetical protein
MAHTLFFFLTDEDEVAFFRALEPLQIQVYPEVTPKGFQPFQASAANASQLVDEAYYFALPQFGELVTREIRKGPHKGMLEMDEIRSPVIHYERSRLDEDGELRSGKLWAELDVVGDRQKLMSKPDLLKGVFDRLRGYLKKLHHSEPNGFFIGHHAARRAKEGLVLREAGRKGETVTPFK